ncbi:hypothetical protein B4U80_11869 [Leptotrombidium deliense]|uniref:Uncharacterized protein n=1 Tax=Leptotrombidium deliense TaxID=299467 RepID=A0A443STL1_9ACAR|nr:hypothetical protein B4U80_11869 [Leptotrombidium deliense]
MIISFLVVFRTSAANHYKQIVDNEYGSCCRDHFEDITEFDCFISSAIRIEQNVYIFSERKFWTVNSIGKDGFPVIANFTPTSITKLGISREESVFDSFTHNNLIYVQTVRYPFTFVYIFDNLLAKSELLTKCAFGCSDAIHKKYFVSMLSEIGDDKLIIASIDFKEFNEETKIVAIATFDTEREYRVKELKKYRKAILNETLQLSIPKYHTFAAVVVAEDKEQQYYWTFHRNNWACFMNRTFKNKTLTYDFEDLGPTDLLPQCFRSQVFFGCPQSFCYNHEVDDFLVANVAGKRHVLLFRGIYFWMFDNVVDIPLPTPLTKNAILINSDYPWKEFNIEHIDAAEAITEGVQEFVVVVKQQKVTTFHNGIYKVDMNINDAFPGFPKGETVDALWFNEMQKKLFLFFNDKYLVYKYNTTETGIYWYLDSDQILGLFDSFRGLPSEIDAILSKVNSHKSYFLKGSWLYVVPTIQWKSNEQITYKPSNTFDPSVSFFSTASNPCFIGEKLYFLLLKSKLDKYTKPTPATASYNSTARIDLSKLHHKHNPNAKLVVGFSFILCLAIVAVYVIFSVFDYKYFTKPTKRNENR